MTITSLPGRARPTPRTRAGWRGAAAVAAALSLLSGCGSGDAGDDGGPVTLTWTTWSTAEPTTRAGTEKVIAAFEKENPNINVKVEAIPFPDTGNQLLLRLRARNAPDIAQTAGNVTMMLAESGGLEPLDEYAGGGYRDSIRPELAELGTFDGSLVAVPKTVAPFAFWYNKKIMAEAGLDPNQPPATIAEFEKALAAVKKANPKAITFGLDTTNRDFGLDQMWAWMAAFEATPIQDGRPVADPARYTEFLTWMRGLAESGYISPNQKIGFFRPLAAQGDVAFTWDGPYLKGVIQKANGQADEEFYDTWGVTTQPVGPSGQSHTVPTDHQLVMFAGSEHKEAAWKLMKFLSTSEHAVTKYTLPIESSLPPLAEPSDKVATLLDTPVFTSYQEKVIPTVERPAWGELYSSVYDPVMAAVQRAITSDESIDAISGDLAKALQGAG